MKLTTEQRRAMLTDMAQGLRTDLKIGLGLMAVVVILGLIFGGTNAFGATLVAGHRGATGVPGYPEQSLKAIGYAATYGAMMAEGDVRFTENDYAVMAHNATAPGCTVPISTQTFAELTALLRLLGDAPALVLAP